MSILKRFIFGIFIIALLLVYYFNFFQKNFNADKSVEYKAVITNIDKNIKSDEFGNSTQMVTVKILNGKLKNKSMTIPYSTSNYIGNNVKLNINSKVLVMKDSTEGYNSFVIVDNYRLDYIGILIISFIIIMIIVGGFRGIFSLISLFFAVAIIIMFGIPFILKGYNPIIISILCTVLILLVTLILVSGINYKSLSTFLGTTIGVLISGYISYIIGIKANLTGLSFDESQMLFYIPQMQHLSPQGILFSGIIFGSLGAIMDVCMSISSSLFEIDNANSSLSFFSLFKSGMNVGRDIMGTMSNTLILAYLGTSMPLLILIMISNSNLAKIINLDYISTDIIRSLAGSIGLILAIPFTIIISCILLKLKNKKSIYSNLEDLNKSLK